MAFLQAYIPTTTVALTALSRWITSSDLPDFRPFVYRVREVFTFPEPRTWRSCKPTFRPRPWL